MSRDLPDYADERDFADATHGLVASYDGAAILDADGNEVWSPARYEFVDGEAPETVNPSLWRQTKLLRIAGLFEVCEGVYQLRGFDLSNMHVIEGADGIIVVDPLITTETAAAAIALYRQHRGDRPIKGLVYTHSHIDHFGGAKGLFPDGAPEDLPVLAPAGFTEEAVGENVFCGTAMARRAAYMYAADLDPGPEGQMGAGLGLTTSTGTISLIRPNEEVSETGEERVLDGIRMRFQITSDSEAPANMSIFFPEHQALCTADIAVHGLHNLMTPRGALVRDGHAWARQLGEALDLFGDEVEVLFAGHHWPIRGNERVRERLALQRDLYTYLHDQTVRMINLGYTGGEIAEELELPASLAAEWSCRDYYGSVSHNVKAIYQRYMGWFDGNPAHLWQHPPSEAGKRYVDLAGGPDALLEKARAAFEAGDFRWVAEITSHLVFADPQNEPARELEADALEQLGYGAENATWRNFFLMGSRELREGRVGAPTIATPLDMVSALTVEQILDAMALRLNGPRAATAQIGLRWEISDTGEAFILNLSNGALTHRPARKDAEAPVTLRMERSTLDALIAKTEPVEDLLGSGRITVEGDPMKLGELLSLLDEPDPDFEIVAP